MDFSFYHGRSTENTLCGQTQELETHDNIYMRCLFPMLFRNILPITPKDCLMFWPSVLLTRNIWSAYRAHVAGKRFHSLYYIYTWDTLFGLRYTFTAYLLQCQVCAFYLDAGCAVLLLLLPTFDRQSLLPISALHTKLWDTRPKIIRKI